MKVFHVSWNHPETVFHEMPWKKDFTVYPSLYANCILLYNYWYFWKRKICESFMRSVHVLNILLYIVLRKLVNSLNYVLIRYKQHCVGFISYLDVIGLWSKNLILRIFVWCSLYKVLPDCLISWLVVFLD